MSDFRFDSAKSFDDNFEAFLTELESTQPDLATILRTHAPLLAAIMVDGERDQKKRGEFNAAVLQSLDELLVTQQSDGDM